MEHDITEKAFIQYKNQADRFFDRLEAEEGSEKSWNGLAKLVTETYQIATTAVLEAMTPAYAKMIEAGEEKPNIKIAICALRIRKALEAACGGDLKEYAKQNEFSALQDRAYRFGLLRSQPAKSAETSDQIVNASGLKSTKKSPVRVVPFKPR